MLGEGPGKLFHALNKMSGFSCKLINFLVSILVMVWAFSNNLCLGLQIAGTNRNWNWGNLQQQGKIDANGCHCKSVGNKGVTRLDGAWGKKQVWRPHVRT